MHARANDDLLLWQLGDNVYYKVRECFVYRDGHTASIS